jgi:hypothetical protein
MFCPGDDMILQFAVDQLEHLRIPGYAHRDISVMLRVILGFLQSLNRDNIPLQLANFYLNGGLDP